MKQSFDQGTYQPMSEEEFIYGCQTNQRELRKTIRQGTACVCIVLAVAGGIYLEKQRIDRKKETEDN
jgi:hypothetical protein